jgi:S1-C subfamily serine protease
MCKKWTSILLALLLADLTSVAQNLQKRPQSSIPQLIRTSKPAIVGIATEQVISGSSTRNMILVGSGFFASSDGYVVTADHVLRQIGAGEVLVFRDGKGVDASVVTRQPEHDLAILKITGENLPYLRFGRFSDAVEGEDVVFIGHPFGNPALISAKGMIAYVGNTPLAVSGQIVTGNLVEVDGPVNGGNSGGPLLKVTDGTVIGVIEAKHGQIGDYLESLKGDKGGGAAIGQRGPGGAGSSVDIGRFVGDVSTALDTNLQLGIGYAISAEYAERAVNEAKNKAIPK